MLQIMKKQPNYKKSIDIDNINHDIIVFKPIEEIEYKDNKKIITTKYEKENITKKVNATSKLLKANSLETKVEELKKILNK